MSIKLKALLAFGLLTVISACAQQEEEAVMVEEPVMEEMSMDKM